jgi:hypothetical protein
VSESEAERLRTWNAWRELHQPFELDWWREHIPEGHLDDPGFTTAWDEVRGFIEPAGRVIDIGCGPRPPFAPCVVIEPLADEYRKIVSPEWWRDVEVHAQPAEKLVPGLRGDTIICWNCIDHAVGWRSILESMRLYGNPGAKFAIATDFHAPFLGHPGFERDVFEAEIAKLFVVDRQREPFGRHLAMVMRAREA